MPTPDPNFPSAPYPPGTHITPPPRPPSPSTSSFRLNHLMLRIKNPTQSLKFYNDCLGLHTVFIFNAGPWTIYYLGPRDVSITSLGSSQGLLELYHIPGDEGTEYVSGNEYDRGAGVGFGHVGFTVPDVAAALSRVQSFGFQIIKPLGEAEVSTMGLPPRVGEAEVNEGYKHVFRQLAFVRDPDGYWVELVPQVVKAVGET
ncbi:Glyoxalase/Bleomycin resistance protein/Dihydroxybiphenyl dioxygenase [Bimuria novae-zelandiae CBS 107.79]|uniref:Glyoxalase/Bleomycin resistance protein/Dihydroxybiphenyl dioxygenase n=1 Tax=Bimuria novae-zelandiae CBS 107.79 TaxID=1447943 RepID=A0A6A5V5G7_9PLEO|nr:Glyoxalase/Bleomycin resistance protein/Dihydroxybiphenyl dioxygenase [Bimuria novae-zelandiae CBS 107.79]